MAEELIWRFISNCVDDEEYLPSWHEIAESLENQITLDDFDHIKDVVSLYVSTHNLEEVRNEYRGECV